MTEEKQKITELEPRIIVPFLDTYRDAVVDRLTIQQCYDMPERINTKEKEACLLIVEFYAKLEKLHNEYSNQLTQLLGI